MGVVKQIIRAGLIGGLLWPLSSCTEATPAESETSEAAVALNVSSSVVALGRLTPKGDVIKLSVANAQDSRVNQILVNEGDWVEAGEVIAILQGIERRQRDLDEALKNVEFFQARLRQLEAGQARDSEIAAQEASIARLEAQLQTESLERQAGIDIAKSQLEQARRQYDRQMMLIQAGAISSNEADLAQEALETAEATLAQRQAQLDTTTQTLQQQITQQKEVLNSLREVRPVDIQVAVAELERSQIAVEQRRADLEDTKVKAPVAGQILRINTQVGEQVNTQQGIVELGQTDQMYAVAEVYETDISKVQVGQPAQISSEYGGFEGEIMGVVDHIGLQIGRRTLSDGSANPSTDENARVVEVKIQIDSQDSPKVANLTNMQVRVRINTETN